MHHNFLLLQNETQGWCKTSAKKESQQVILTVEDKKVFFWGELNGH